MSIDVYFREEIRAKILAGLILVLQTAKEGQVNVAFVKGVLALAQHQALGFGICWDNLLGEVKSLFSSDLIEMIESKQVVITNKFRYNRKVRE